MAERRLVFHQEARLEALEAHDYYAEKSVALGKAFEAELANAINAIASDPQIWATYLFGTQRYLMRRFPFVVVYRERADQVDIIAVAHGHQRPGYWKNRK